MQLLSVENSPFNEHPNFSDHSRLQGAQGLFLGGRCAEWESLPGQNAEPVLQERHRGDTPRVTPHEFFRGAFPGAGAVRATAALRSSAGREGRTDGRTEGGSAAPPRRLHRLFPGVLATPATSGPDAAARILAAGKKRGVDGEREGGDGAVTLPGDRPGL